MINILCANNHITRKPHPADEALKIVYPCQPNVLQISTDISKSSNLSLNNSSPILFNDFGCVTRVFLSANKKFMIHHVLFIVSFL